MATNLADEFVEALLESGMTAWDLYRLTGYSPRYYEQVAAGTANIDAPGHYGKLVSALGGGRDVALWRTHDEAWVRP